MKRISLSVLSLVLLVTSGCKKGKEEPVKTPSPVEGFWIGKYNTSTGVAGIYNKNYAMLINGDGTARVYDMGSDTDTTSLGDGLQKISGIWVLNGNSLEVTYPAGTDTGRSNATVNAAFTSMSGAWSVNSVIKGSFYLNR